MSKTKSESKSNFEHLGTDEVLVEETKQYSIFKQPISMKYNIILSEEVSSPSYKYRGICRILRDEVKEEDEVNIYIANYGGCCDTTASIINAMKACEGTVNCIVTSPSYSAATMIALAGDTLELNPYSFLMFHNFSSRTGGKAGELKAGVLNTERVIHGMMRGLYKDFLTEKEIEDIFQDKDVYVHWDDESLKHRLKSKFNTGE